MISLTKNWMIFMMLLGTSVFAKSQSQIPEIYSFGKTSIDFDLRGIDAEQQQSMGLLPLFFLKGDSVAQFLDLSSATMGEKVEHRKIVPPKNISINAAYGYFFQNHETNNFSPNHTLFLIENPTQMHRKHALIWVDRNHDFDLTNDRTDTLKMGKSNGVIQISGSEKSNGVLLESFPYQQFKQFAKMSDDAILLQQGNRTYVGSRFSLRETRYNLWYSRMQFDGDTLDFGIKDVNCNGRFNDIGIDRLYIKSMHSETFQANNSVALSKKTHLFWMGNCFEVDIQDAQLQNSTIQKIIAQSNDFSLSVGQKFPRFKFCVAEKPVYRKQVRKLKSDYLFVYVWSAENENFIKDSSMMHQIQRNLPSNFKILMLNHGGSGKYVYRYNKRYETNFFHGFCSPIIAKKLKLQSMPQSFLLDSRQNILKIGMTAAQFQRFIAKNTLSK